jgi:ubiquinone/menaquinone biosynthesis C-methylase UbiE
MTLPSYAMNQASFPEMYERWLVGPLFRPWAELTLDEVGLSQGDRLLDVACGTGIVARVARERLGAGRHIVGVDISPGMLAVASASVSDIDWREGDANALPLHDDEQFDVVVCQQGLQFFPNKAVATAQLRRALATGGRLAVTTWRSDDEIPFFRELRGVAERSLGAILDQRHSFGNAGPLEKLLQNAGFKEIQLKTLSRTLRFEDGAPLLRLNTMALIGMSDRGKMLNDQERSGVVEAIVRESAPVLQRYTDGAGLAFEFRTNLATARG